VNRDAYPPMPKKIPPSPNPPPSRRRRILTSEEAEILRVLKMQHEAIDRVFALIISKQPLDEPNPFYPSQSGQPWEAMIAGNDLIRKMENLNV
jgi:hypothetical protein